MNERTEEDLQQAFDKMYSEIDAVSDVGPEFYASFCSMNDREMTALVRFVLSDRAKEINQKLDQKTFNVPWLLQMTTQMLKLISRGMLKARDDGKCVIYRTVGPAPTPEELEAIDERIKASHAIILNAFLENFNKQ
jgi:hypothetical protein